MTGEDDIYREWDSAYVLGALSPSERLEFERHLATCASCSAAVADLAGVPGVLRRLSTDEAVMIQEQTGVQVDAESRAHGVRLQTLAKAERASRRHWFSGAAAACVLAVALGAGGTIVATSKTGGPSTLAMLPAGKSGLTADISVQSKPWGTRLDWSCTYGQPWRTGMPGPRSYELVVTMKSGKEVVVANWQAGGKSAKNLSASSTINTSDIRSLDIRRTSTSEQLASTSL